MSQTKAEIFKNRREKFYSAMEQKGLNKAIVGRPTTLYYLTGVMFTPYERFFGLALDSSKHDCTMVLPSLEQGAMGRGGSDIREEIFLDSESPKAAIGRALGGGKKIGLEMNYFSIAVGRQIASSDVELVDVGDLVRELRMCKDALEIETIRLAALCADQALADALPMLRPGVSEKEFAMEVLRLMIRDPKVNSDSYVIQILGGANSANPHGASSDYVFQYGDAVTIDFGAYYDYYWSDFCRTYFLGEAPAKLKETYPIVLEAHLAGMNVTRPGIMAKEIDDAARGVITRAGYGEYFIHRTGHGVGLDIHEDPYMHAKNETILEEGMVFTCEPGVYFPGLGGIRIEDDVAVTKDGWRSLNTYPKDFEKMII